MAKSYQLMAWTDKGQVKMIPSLVAELAEPYVQRIQALEDKPRAHGEDAEVGFLLHTPLEHRFLSMYNSCRQLAEEHPAIKGSIQWQKLLRDWRRVTDVHRIWNAEFREVTQNARAWHFGKR